MQWSGLNTKSPMDMATTGKTGIMSLCSFFKSEYLLDLLQVRPSVSERKIRKLQKQNSERLNANPVAQRTASKLNDTAVAVVLVSFSYLLSKPTAFFAGGKECNMKLSCFLYCSRPVRAPRL